MGFGYTWEKLHTGIQFLLDEGPLAERLQRALGVAAVLDKDDHAFPNAELRERWRKLVDALTHGSAREEWPARLAAVSEDDRQVAAHEWLAIFLEVARLDHEDELRRSGTVL